jgi:hypothetical protein
MTTYSYRLTLSATEFADTLVKISYEIKNIDSIYTIDRTMLINTMIKGFDINTRSYTFSVDDSHYNFFKDVIGESFWERTRNPVMTSTSSSCWTEFDKN